jgi:hypothetical protein
VKNSLVKYERRIEKIEKDREGSGKSGEKRRDSIHVGYSCCWDVPRVY